jgi:uncharacterized protein (TIGR02611 family)
VASESAKPGLVERLQAQRGRHRERPKPVRALYVVAGFTILLAGVVMLITPGPAFVVIPIGLALLSLEFRWAEQLLERAVVQGRIAQQKAAATTTIERILTGIAVLLAGGAVVAWALLGDIPLLPV